jgi:hypothetical protein
MRELKLMEPPKKLSSQISYHVIASLPKHPYKTAAAQLGKSEQQALPLKLGPARSSSIDTTSPASFGKKISK